MAADVPLIRFTNCQLCISGELIPGPLTFSPETSLIVAGSTLNHSPHSLYGVQDIDLQGAIVAPGFLDLQTNGMVGVHFTQLRDQETDDAVRLDEQRLTDVAKREVTAGVTGWWATIPTVAEVRWKEILPALTPRSFTSGADLLGAHCEGPYLHSSKKGAHNSAFFKRPSDTPPTSLYGNDNLLETVKIITLAPELPSSLPLITTLHATHPHIALSLGHSSATHAQGLAALAAGATSLTHVFNAMAPLHHRDPGLAGLMGSGSCFYSVIPDGIHLHPAVLRLAFRANPTKCMLITDSIELAGLPDGVYPGHGQIKQKQVKAGSRVTIEGTETLIGSCCTLDECVLNMVRFGACDFAEAVRCVTENVAEMMGEGMRGKLVPGRRADFAVFRQGVGDGELGIWQTWMGGRKVWEQDVKLGLLSP